MVSMDVCRVRAFAAFVSRRPGSPQWRPRLQLSRLPPTIGRRGAMFWTASDNHNLLPRAASRRADASIPSASRSRRPGEALDERAPDKTTNSPGGRRDRFGAHTANQRWPRELALQGLLRVKGHRSSACRELRILNSREAVPSCDPRAPKSKSTDSPHAALDVEGSWCTETSALLRFETGQVTTWKRL
jgi:hypothetical protein